MISIQFLEGDICVTPYSPCVLVLRASEFFILHALLTFPHNLETGWTY